LLVRAPLVNGAGVGKGLLVRTICIVAFGTAPSAITAGDSAAEMDKRLVSEFVQATQSVFLDNFNATELRSDTLAAVLTERPSRVRILGKSETVQITSTAFVAVTGNGVSVAEDLVRRFVSCELDAHMEHPESRPFAPNFLANTLQNRDELLAAALTIWRWGQQNEAVRRKGRPCGSFEMWGVHVRDPLLALGCADPVERMTENKKSDPARQRIAEIYALWNHHHEQAFVSANDLHDDVKSAIMTPLSGGMERFAGGLPQSRQALASAVNALVGTRASGSVLRKSIPLSKSAAAQYALMPTREDISV
jgi:hypothetical protein